jgi:hypothetical protein
VHGRLVDTSTGAGIPGALVSIEKGGQYVPITDPSLGSPAYQYGATTRDDGSFDVVVAGGTIGVHTFSKDHFYGTQGFDVKSDPYTLTIQSAPLRGDVKPTLTNARAEPSSVAPGGTFNLIVTATAGQRSDPLSDEIIAVEGSTHWTAELDPPSPGNPGRGYPDGEYRKSVVAPSSPGAYNYQIAATTEACVTGDPVTVIVSVR